MPVRLSEDWKYKLQPGQMVRVVNNHGDRPDGSSWGMAALPGARAIIASVDVDNKYWLDLEWIRDELSGRQSDGRYSPDAFELIEDDRPPLEIMVASYIRRELGNG